MATPAAKLYRYSVEITQMSYVFGTSEPEEEVVQYIEDIVRSQIAEMVIQARGQASRRGSRHLSVEDLIFLIRHDRAKFNRLRTYLSWKDVRKKVKDSEADEAPEIDSMEEPATEKALRTHKMKIKIPWEILTIFSEHLKEDSEGEDDDDVEAYEDSKKRLKEADDLTKGMTKEQYQHYADCRQASFTYRKAKRFREFVNLGAYIEGNPNDEVMDVLGFLAYEMVRSLCESASEIKRAMALSRAKKSVMSTNDRHIKNGKRRSKDPKRSADDDCEQPENEDSHMNDLGPSLPTSSRISGAAIEGSSSQTPSRKSRTATGGNRPLTAPTSLFSEPKAESPVSGRSTPNPDDVAGAGGDKGDLAIHERPAIQLHEVNAGYVAMQQGQASLKASGMRNWRGGCKRVKVGLI